MFQLTDEEFHKWKSQIVISKMSDSSFRMGLRTKPYVFTDPHRDKNGNLKQNISQEDALKFNAQYPKLEIIFNNTFHDRFLIIDDRDLYLIGASLKDLGKNVLDSRN